MAYEMPFESRHFMSNGCFNIECRFESFLRRLAINGVKIIWFEIKPLILHADLWPLNQRVQGSGRARATLFAATYPQ